MNDACCTGQCMVAAGAEDKTIRAIQSVMDSRHRGPGRGPRSVRYANESAQWDAAAAG